jgi:gluconolactonase
VRYMAVSILLAIGAVLSSSGQATQPPAGDVLRADAALDGILAPSSKIEKVKSGLGFAEGPVWVQEGGSGYLLFSDIPANAIFKMLANGETTKFSDRSGYTGSEDPDVRGIGAINNNGIAEVKLIGSNGIAIDPQGRIVFCAHGDRSVVRLENGKRTVLAERYQGKRLNSPNDLVFKSDGSLYFTDHVAGLRARDKDPNKELPFQGVFLLKDGKLQLVIDNLGLPNGIALSPDEKVLYVGSLNGTDSKVLMRYDVRPDSTVAGGRVFFDMSADKSADNPDGMKVDEKGNVYATGPGGVWIISPQGKHLGTIRTPELPANLAFGDADRRTIYMTARTSIYRIRGQIPGERRYSRQ